MRSIKKIKLICENCDIVDITKAVGDFNISDIDTKICRIAVNAIGKHKTAGLINFQILGDGILPPIQVSNMSPIDRILNHNDISGIELVYEDDTTETIYPDFDGDWSNKNQKSKEYNGDVFVVISATKKFEDVYSDETMEELYNSRELNIDNLANATKTLKQAGWHIHFVENEYYQLQKENTFITISKNTTYIYLPYKQKDYVIDNTVFFCICELVFRLCSIKEKVNRYNSEDRIYITVENESSNEQTGEVQVTLSFFIGIKKIEALLKFDRDTKNNPRIYKGSLSFDDICLSTETLNALMLVLIECLDEETWEKL